MDCAEVLTRADATDTVKYLVGLALRKRPLLPLDVGRGRFFFASDQDI